jgi:hypothetical protein
MRTIESLKKKYTRGTLRWTVVVALALPSAVAYGEPATKPAATAPADRLEAQKQFAAGNKLRKKGENAEALVAFV